MKDVTLYLFFLAGTIFGMSLMFLAVSVEEPVPHHCPDDPFCRESCAQHPYVYEPPEPEIVDQPAWDETL